MADLGAITGSCCGEPNKHSAMLPDQAVLCNTNVEIKLMSHVERMKACGLEHPTWAEILPTFELGLGLRQTPEECRLIL